MTDKMLGNPVTGDYLKTWGLIPLFGFIVANLWIYLEDGFHWSGIIIAGSLALVFFFAVPWRLEYLDRPRLVEIIDTGVVIHQRYGRRPLFVPWSGFKLLNVIPVNPIVDGRRHSKDGTLFIKDSKQSFTLNWDVAMEVRRAYYEHMGHYPVNVSTMDHQEL